MMNPNTLKLLLEIGVIIFVLSQVLYPLWNKEYKMFWLFRESLYGENPLESRVRDIYDKEEHVKEEKEHVKEEIDESIKAYTNLKSKINKPKTRTNNEQNT